MQSPFLVSTGEGKLERPTFSHMSVAFFVSTQHTSADFSVNLDFFSKILQLGLQSGRCMGIFLSVDCNFFTHRAIMGERLMTVTPIQSAKAWWSREQEGWLVRIVYLSGTVTDIAPAPSVYHEPRDADRDHIVRETLNYENLEPHT